MRNALVSLLLASTAGLLAAYYFGALLSGPVGLIAVLFGGGLAMTGLYYLDLRWEGRSNQDQIKRKG
jgi:hypothetical protein